MELKRLVNIILIMVLCSTLAVSQSGEFFADTEQSLRNQVELFPNPVIQDINIHITHQDIKNPEFTLHNIIGNEIKIKSEQVASFKYRINLEDLAPGYYLLIIRDRDARLNETYKFLKR